MAIPIFTTFSTFPNFPEVSIFTISLAIPAISLVVRAEKVKVGYIKRIIFFHDGDP